MADTWIVDLRHYLTPAGALLTAPKLARKLAEYFAEIVAQGSNYDEPITLRCRRRPQRRACTGVLEIRPDTDLDGMVWHCPICEITASFEAGREHFGTIAICPQQSCDRTSQHGASTCHAVH